MCEINDPLPEGHRLWCPPDSSDFSIVLCVGLPLLNSLD